MASEFIPKMAKRTATMRAHAAKINATRSWPWVLIRILEIILCVAILGISLYLRFSWHRSSLARRDALPGPKEDYTPPWFNTDDGDDFDPQAEADDDFNYHASSGAKGRWGFSPYVALGIFMAGALSSLLSSFSTLLLYCCDRLSLKFVLVWDLILALVWLAGNIFMGKLITDNLGWGSHHFIAVLYKADFFLAIFVGVLFIVSSILGLRLTLAARRAAGGKYAPMTMAPPYVASQKRGETGSTYTGPESGEVHDGPDKLASEHHS